MVHHHLKEEGEEEVERVEEEVEVEVEEVVIVEVILPLDPTQNRLRLVPRNLQDPGIVHLRQIHQLHHRL